ncbi:MAG TPA: hypothetical protein VKD08_11895 [Ignavibacteriaceae bacterium]|nr:hypothetical protein [Ignavibacteriaceae bacterium]
MRTKIFFISFIFILIAYNLFPQEKQLFGFGDLDWNSSKVQVKELMKNRYHLSPGYEREDAIGYQGGQYFKEELFLWVYFFNNDSLQEVDLVVKNNDRPVGGIFYEVVHTLSEDYGDPDLYKPDDWTAEWFYYDFPGKKLKATIKVSPYFGETSTTLKISFLKAPI